MAASAAVILAEAVSWVLFLDPTDCSRIQQTDNRMQTLRIVFWLSTNLSF